MTEMTFKDKYPVVLLEIGKDETTFKNVDEILAYLKSKIDEHDVASFIAIFDHYTHTSNLKDCLLSPDILDAKNIICCFGKELPDPIMMAVRPRSIGVAEMSDKFIVSFIEVPNPKAHETMVSWVKSIVNK